MNNKFKEKYIIMIGQELYEKWANEYSEDLDGTPSYIDLAESSWSASWKACKGEILELFKHPKLNMENTDLKYLLEEIKKL